MPPSSTASSPTIVQHSSPELGDCVIEISDERGKAEFNEKNIDVTGSGAASQGGQLQVNDSSPAPMSKETLAKAQRSGVFSYIPRLHSSLRFPHTISDHRKEDGRKKLVQRSKPTR